MQLMYRQVKIALLLLFGFSISVKAGDFSDYIDRWFSPGTYRNFASLFMPLGCAASTTVAKPSKESRVDPKAIYMAAKAITEIHDVMEYLVTHFADPDKAKEQIQLAIHDFIKHGFITRGVIINYKADLTPNEEFLEKLLWINSSKDRIVEIYLSAYTNYRRAAVDAHIERVYRKVPSLKQHRALLSQGKEL